VSSSCFFRFYNICLKCIIQMFIFILLDLFISYHVNIISVMDSYVGFNGMF
jgi:hypothetical protein